MDMRSNILLIAHGASSSDSVIAHAAMETSRGLRHASTSHEAFEILADNTDHIDVVVIDIDSEIDNLSVLEALSYGKAVPPIIVITGFGDKNMSPTAYRHGATACIGRPFTAREIGAMIEDVCGPECQTRGGSCDRWGHPPRAGTKSSRIGHAYEHVHNMTL
jgi:DNA-binding NtrC family response regulator